MTKPKAKSKKLNPWKSFDKALEIKKEPEKVLTKEEKVEVKRLEVEIKILVKERKKIVKQEDDLCSRSYQLEEEGPNYEISDAIINDMREIPRVSKQVGIDPRRYIEACKLYLKAWKDLDKKFAAAKKKVDEEIEKVQEKKDSQDAVIDDLKEKRQELKPSPSFF
jgi:chromosome condensin MukBEF ATPase and DNA-binding subunit MukB